MPYYYTNTRLKSVSEDLDKTQEEKCFVFVLFLLPVHVIMFIILFPVVMSTIDTHFYHTRFLKENLHNIKLNRV